MCQTQAPFFEIKFYFFVCCATYFSLIHVLLYSSSQDDNSRVSDVAGIFGYQAFPEMVVVSTIA